MEVRKPSRSLRLPDSTLGGFETDREGGRSLAVRRAVLALLLVTIVAGLVGWLGGRSTTSSATQAPWTLEVEHAAVARAGLDVPWEVTVRRAGGFDGPVVLALTGEYLDIYETQAFHPQPSASWRDGDLMYLEFDEPSGDTMVLAYDAYIQPGSQRGASGTVSVVEGGLQLATVRFSTTLVP